MVFTRPGCIYCCKIEHVYLQAVIQSFWWWYFLLKLLFWSFPPYLSACSRAAVRCVYCLDVEDKCWAWSSASSNTEMIPAALRAPPCSSPVPPEPYVLFKDKKKAVCFNQVGLVRKQELQVGSCVCIPFAAQKCVNRRNILLMLAGQEPDGHFGLSCGYGCMA